MRKADVLSTFLCRLSGNLGASSSWNSKGMNRPIMDKRTRGRTTFCVIRGSHIISEFLENDNSVLKQL